MKPKLHLLLELGEEQGSPASCWTYRDESWGGTVAAFARRRAGTLTTASCSNNLLQRFFMQPMVRL